MGSDSDDKRKGAVQTLTEEGKALIGKMYDDAAKPAVVQVGKTLGLAVEAALSPVNLVLGSVKVSMGRLSAAVERKLGGVSPDRLLSPPATIMASAALHYTLLGDGDEVAELQEMFENLLVSSMDSQTTTNAHPAFVSIISQLTPDEARILKSINRTPLLHQFGFSERLDEDLGKVGGEYIFTQFERFCTDAGVAHPSLSGSYLDNLLRLKLLKEDISTEGRFHPEGENPASVTTMTTRLIQLSEFGERFLKACVQR
jgi:hypothetical protein